ncbi:DDE 3 domain-containing protein [Aphis craccivora]|uniref:DDE 3 domain-containing protein n=1 Tax=Aphis craccivora TaxID=307492 RepID=A0A6G0VQW6_APHCR|nr:DDE 3 domain-containing protein [Aphis craccivora]
MFKTQAKTAEACGVSEKTVKRITAEGNKSSSESQAACPSFTSPRKTYKRIKFAGEVDGFDVDIVRRIVHDFYDKREYPTTSNILVEYKKRTKYKGSSTSMWRMRVKFLRTIVNLRQNNDTRPVIYLDETWVNQNHTKGYIWQNEFNSEGLKVPTGKESRLIICHAGSSSFEFVPGSKLIFRCQSEEPSVIVMYSAPYHSVLVENYPKIPKANEKKENVQKWLSEKGVEYSPLETLSKLRERVKQLVPRQKIYKLDQIVLEIGHEVVRLPPYHCQYNPIELIWARVKGDVAKKNVSFKIAYVEKLVNEALDAVTVDSWKKCISHCEKFQEEDFIKDGLRDEILEPIIMTINPDEDSDDSEDEDDINLNENCNL